MAKNTIYDYSTSAVSNTDIAGIGIQGSNAVSNFDDAFRTIMAQIAADVSPRRMAIQGALYGLTLSNNAGDAVNDIDIAVGMATTDSTTDPRTMVLGTAITKRLDAAWAVGTNQGGLDTGSIANTTYHVWLIQRSDTGVVDALFSASATSPTMPTNYDRKRRIGSIIRLGATILAFVQNGDRFILGTPQPDASVTNPGITAVTRALTVPVGIVVEAIITAFVNSQTLGGTYQLYISSLDVADISPAGTGADQLRLSTAASGTTVWRANANLQVKTNTSAQVRTRLSASDANTSININTFGWVDARGRT